MEEARMHVMDQDIYNYFGRLKEVLENCPAPLAYNMDEMGHEEYADRKEKTVVVPSNVQGQVYYEVSRQGKRITLVACVAADGSFVKPSLIISRKTFEDELVLFGFVPGENVDFYNQGKAYMDHDIFYTWLRDTLIPDIVKKRKALHYKGPACLILDNCSSHKGDDVDALCEKYNLKLLWIPPHSSHFLQPLDVSFFGVAKNRIRSVNKIEDVNHSQ
jgi:hypothetical protein